MIKFENAEIYGFESAIRGMQNSCDLWDRSDSFKENGEFIIGVEDLKLMKRLTKAGPDHRKFMRQIFVSVDITAPIYWWKEYDTYKVGTTVNSCSTMCAIANQVFTLDDFSCEHLISLGQLSNPPGNSVDVLIKTIDSLNFWCDRYKESEQNRKKYFEHNGYSYVPSKKDCWWQIIQLLPSSYNQKRTCTLNYENLINMYYARRNHKLDEWHRFCEWAKTLPYVEELITAAKSEAEQEK